MEYANIFIAGCVGALVLFGLLERSGTGDQISKKAMSSNVVLLIGQVLLAGYLAASILEVSKPLHAFLVGVRLDRFLCLLRGAAERFAKRSERSLQNHE